MIVNPRRRKGRIVRRAHASPSSSSSPGFPRGHVQPVCAGQGALELIGSILPTRLGAKPIIDSCRWRPAARTRPRRSPTSRPPDTCCILWSQGIGPHLPCSTCPGDRRRTTHLRRISRHQARPGREPHLRRRAPTVGVRAHRARRSRRAPRKRRAERGHRSRRYATRGRPRAVCCGRRLRAAPTPVARR